MVWMYQKKNQYILRGKSFNLTLTSEAQHDLPLSESDLSDDMAEPWLSFLILSEPLCSCSSRTRSSLCCQRRRPFSCSASSSCSCSFWKGGRLNLRHGQAPSTVNITFFLCRRWWGFSDTARKKNNNNNMSVTAVCRVHLYVKLGSSQQVEGGVPHGVRWQGDLLLELLQAVPQLSSSAKNNKQKLMRFKPCKWQQCVY